MNNKEKSTINELNDEIILKNINYNCPECSSIIEIISINENSNIIEYQCYNKHNKKVMKIKEFLEKINIYRNKKINEDICKIHSINNNKFISYCFDCNLHLCKECLGSKKHVNHFKNNIFEIQPDIAELDIMKEIIEDYKKEINKLKIEKLDKNKELEKYIIKEKKIYEEKKRRNKTKKEKELKINKDKYFSEIKEIKKIYDGKIKSIRYEFENNIKNIDNKYKIINENDSFNYNLRINELNKKYTTDKFQINDIKIENLYNLITINEIVYNTYNTYKNNYYNAKNINNIIINYSKNGKIKNSKIEALLKNINYKNSNLSTDKKEIQRNKNGNEFIDLKIKKIIVEYENKIIEENKKLTGEYENKLKKFKLEYEKEINELKEKNEKKLKEYE